MTPKQQFEEWNKQGFEGDPFIEAKIANLCKQFKISTLIETGARYGHTTKKLAKYGSTISCETNELNYKIAKENLINKETGKEIALLFNCSSVDLFKTNLKALNNQRILFFLDAHWNGTPLLNELVEIQKAGITPVIVIHDFKVPNRPEFGFDTYDGQPYCFEWIKPYIDAIYAKDGYSIDYNEEAEGAKRGVIYITPNEMETVKRTKEEISEEIGKHMSADVQAEAPTPEQTPEQPKQKRKKRKKEND